MSCAYTHTHIYVCLIFDIYFYKLPKFNKLNIGQFLPILLTTYSSRLESVHHKDHFFAEILISFMQEFLVCKKWFLVEPNSNAKFDEVLLTKSLDIIFIKGAQMESLR